MYAGISGSTHGEIKLTNPAKNASVKEIIITLDGAFCDPNIVKLLTSFNDNLKSVLFSVLLMSYFM